MRCRRFVIDSVNGAVNVIDLLKDEVKAVVKSEWRAARIADELMRNARENDEPDMVVKLGDRQIGVKSYE